jgi:hypothetical protein
MLVTPKRKGKAKALSALTIAEAPSTGTTPVESRMPSVELGSLSITDVQERKEIKEDKEADKVETLVLGLRRRGGEQVLEDVSLPKINPVPIKFPINFFNHEVVFMDWLNELTSNEISLEVASETIRKSLQTPFLVLATVPGQKVNGKLLGAIRMTLGNLLKGVPPPLETHGHGWVYVFCRTEVEAKMLLDAKIVKSWAIRGYLVFRNPRCTPYTHKAAELRGITSEANWMSARKALLDDGEKNGGIKIVMTYPEKWTETYKERTIWIIAHKEPTYMFPQFLRILVEGEHETKFLQLTRAPTCMICAGEDHHLAVCPYREGLQQKGGYRAGPSNA